MQLSEVWSTMCSNVKRKYSNVGGGKLLVTCRNKLHLRYGTASINCKILNFWKEIIYVKLNIYNQWKFSDQLKNCVAFR